MDRPTCATCPYWDNSLFDNLEHGICRHNSPQPLTPRKEDDSVWAVQVLWPIVDRDDWCGRHPAMPIWIASLPAS